MINWIKGLFSVFSKLRTRPGLDAFINSWLSTAYSELSALSSINNNKDFHLWKDQAFARLKERTGELKDNWIALLVNLAFEELKSRGIRRP